MSSVKWFAVAVAVVLTAGPVAGQVLPVRLYGGTADEQAHALVEVEGAYPGFCLAGWTRSFGPSGNSKVLVVKTDPVGIPAWSRVSLGPDEEEARSMVTTYDQGYAVCGWTRRGPGTPNKNIFVLKLDAAGNNVWGWIYGGFEDDLAFSIVQTKDSGFVLTGSTASFGPDPKKNILVLKLDKLGLLQWMRAYWLAPTHVGDGGHAIIQTPDLGYAVCGGLTLSSPAFPFLLKLDPAGNIQWVWVSGPNHYPGEAYSVALDLNNDILVAGRTLAFGTAPGSFWDMFVAKFNLAGVLQWSRTYGWPNGDEEVLDDRSLVATTDSGSAVCGPTTSVGPGDSTNFMVMKLNQAGQPVWTRSHPSPYQPGLLSDVPLPMIELSAGGYAVAGWTNSFPSLLGSSDFMLSTFDAQGNRPVCADSQVPVVDTMPWRRAQMAGSAYYPLRDTIVLNDIVVTYDSVCYDTTQTGIRGQGSGARARESGCGLRAAGKRVELSLGRATEVEVKVFTADGRQVGVIARGSMSAGRHELTLPENLGAGTYVVRASAADGCASTKVVMY